MKTNIELRLPRTKRSYYVTIAIEIIVILAIAVLGLLYVGPFSLLVLVGLYIPLQKLIDPMSLVISDEGITLSGYDSSSKEPVFYTWKQVYAIGLYDNSNLKYQLGEIILYIKGQGMGIRIDLERVYDLRDQIYIGRYNKRVRDALQQLCRGHGVQFEVD